MLGLKKKKHQIDILSCDSDVFHFDYLQLILIDAKKSIQNYLFDASFLFRPSMNL